MSSFVLEVGGEPVLANRDHDTSLTVAVDMVGRLLSQKWTLVHIEAQGVEYSATLTSPDGVPVEVRLRKCVVIDATCPVCKERRRCVSLDTEDLMACIVCHTKGTWQEFGLDD